MLRYLAICAGMTMHQRRIRSRALKASRPESKVDERLAVMDEVTQAGIVSMRRIGAAVLVAQECRAERILIWPVRDRRDRKRQRHDLRFEYALRADERNPLSVKRKPAASS
jgi:hypothetical protein